MGKAGVDRYGYRMMANQYASECAWCGKPLPRGKQVWWHPMWKHIVCTPSHRIDATNRPVSSTPAVPSPAMEDLRRRQAEFIPANRRDATPDSIGGNRRLSGLPIKQQPPP